MAATSPTFTVRCIDLNDLTEAARIDAFVRGHPASTPFHLTGWNRAVARGCHQISHYLIAEGGDQSLCGILPLIEIHSPLFGRALVSSGFGVGGGVIADAAIIAEQLTDSAITLANRLSCPTLELRGGTMPGGDWHHDSNTYLGFVRDLAGDDEAELLAIPRKQRAEARKSLGFELDIATGKSQADREAHYHVYATSVRNLGTPVFPRALFEAVLDEFGDDADILTVRHQGQPIASVLSLYFGGAVMPYWGGGTAEARKWRANDLMYFALMRHARNRGCTRFDFGRSKAGTGAAAFKHNWGFEGTPLPYAKHVADGEEMREINPLDPRYRLQIQLWQKLPLWLANRIGPFISRGLG